MSDSNIRELVRHPSVAESPTEELTRRILESRLRNQLVLTWVLGGAGAGIALIVLGLAFATWRLALSIQTG